MYIKKSTQTVSVKLNKFSQKRPFAATTQSKKQKVTSAPASSSYLLLPTPSPSGNHPVF